MTVGICSICSQEPSFKIGSVTAETRLISIESQPKKIVVVVVVVIGVVVVVVHVLLWFM